MNNELNTPQKIITWVIRIIIAVLFFISGYVKAIDFVGFSYKLDEYWMVFGTDFMKPTSLFIAWFMSTLEIGLAFAVLVGYRMKIVTWLLLLMIVFFTFLTGYSWAFDAVKDCGCFGDALKLEPFESFMKDLVLLVLILPLWFWRDKIHPIMDNVIPAVVSWAGFAFFAYLSIYCYRHLPIVDFRPYHIGANMFTQTMPGDWNDYDPKAHDYAPIPCGQNLDSAYSANLYPAGELKPAEYVGKTLIVVVPYIDKACDDAMNYASKLGKELEGSDIKVFGISSSYSSVVADMKKKYDINFCIAGMDETVQKTMIRSNPGYILVDDAIIKGKWHYNDAPSVNELREVLSK